MAKKHNVSDMVMHVTAEVTASKTAKNRCSRRPQSVLTNKPKPFTTVASAVAIFSLATKHKEATTPRKSFKPTLYQIRRSLLSFKVWQMATNLHLCAVLHDVMVTQVYIKKKGKKRGHRLHS
jgi:hypothetical protein